MSRTKYVYIVSKSNFGIVSTVYVFKDEEAAVNYARSSNERFNAFYYVSKIPYIK